MVVDGKSPGGSSSEEVNKPLITLDRGLLVGVEDIDNLHHEFVALINTLVQAEKEEFQTLFSRMLTHTLGHFEFENEQMDRTGFPAREEHKGEHRRVTDELLKLGKEVEKGTIEPARAFLRQRLPNWFRLHILSMDRALADHLEKR